MNHITNLMFRMLEEDIEDDFNILADFDYEESTIRISKNNEIYIEISAMQFHDVWEDESIEIINYELDERYQYLNEENAFEIIKMLAGNLLMSDEF